MKKSLHCVFDFAVNRLVFSLFILAIVGTNASAGEEYKLSECAYGKFSSWFSVEDGKLDSVSYHDYLEYINEYTGKLMVYEKKATLKIDSFVIREGTFVFEVDGIEFDRSDDKFYESPVETVVMLPNETWITRGINSPRKNTIHPSCIYFNADILEQFHSRSQ
ncbi:hypothetical protein N9W79_01550 [bacterium]|nr:hypothetical protein [bacterium]